jgi:hypothetical protein
VIAFEAAIDHRAAIENAGPEGDQDALHRIWSSFEYLYADAAETAASNAEDDARDELIAYPCRSPAEVRRKLEYLASVPLVMETCRGEDMATLVHSLLGKGAADV